MRVRAWPRWSWRVGLHRDQARHDAFQEGDVEKPADEDEATDEDDDGDRSAREAPEQGAHA
jgi:hypothetical protein